MLIENNREGTMGEHLNQQLHGELVEKDRTELRERRASVLEIYLEIAVFFALIASAFYGATPVIVVLPYALVSGGAAVLSLFAYTDWTIPLGDLRT